MRERSFRFNFGNSQSREYSIETVVPQRAALSPLLFCIYINDVPLKERTHFNYFLLFADDIVWLNQFDKPINATKYIKSMLKRLEVWLGKWRLKMAAGKYSHMIPDERVSRFLGLMIDDNLSFNQAFMTLFNQSNPHYELRYQLAAFLSVRYYSVQYPSTVPRSYLMTPN